MASPSLESFCCESRNNHTHEFVFDIALQPYHGVCTVSALIGFLGAIYQTLPYQPIEGISRRHDAAIRSQRKIIRFLAAADALAAAGILVRSITWLSHSTNLPKSKNEIVFCALLSTWIHFFYAATYFWTIVYAIDVYLAAKEKRCPPWIYHSSVWIFSTTFTSIGLSTLYLPDFKCHDRSWHVLIDYICTYTPIMIAMIVNPILYVLASNGVKELLTSYHSQFTDYERDMVSAMKEKFIFIVLVFYCCWSPNIIAGLILWNTWPNIPEDIIVAMMFMTAVLNPLQAFLNSLVYRGWTFCREILCNICCTPALVAEIPPTFHPPTNVDADDELPLVNENIDET